MKWNMRVYILFILSLMTIKVDCMLLNNELYIPSVFYDFGDPERLEYALSPQGKVHGYPYFLNNIKDEVGPFERPTVVIVESAVFRSDPSLVSLYLRMQETPNVTAVMIEDSSIIFFGFVMGYKYGDDISNVTIHVSKYNGRNTKYISDSTLITVWGDRGPFQRFIVSPGYKAIVSITCIFYIAIVFKCIHLFYLGVKERGFSFDHINMKIAISLLSCFGRMLHVAIFTKNEFYLNVPHNYIVSACADLAFWLPLSLGTLAYVLIGFSWIEVTSILEKSRNIEKIRKAVLIYASLYVPASIIFGFVGFFSFYFFYAQFSIIVVTGLITTFVFMFFGRLIILKLGKKKSSLKQTLSKFLFISIGIWLLTLILLSSYTSIVSFFESVATITFFSFSRDFFVISLSFCVVMFTQNLLTSSSQKSVPSSDVSMETRAI